MSGLFYIAHTTRGRTRIRWAGNTADRAGVVEIASQIAALEGIDQAIPRTNTGSIIIEHDPTDWAALESRLVHDLSLKFVSPPLVQPRTAMDTINRGVDQVNGTLKGMNTDLASVSVLVLLILAVTQAARGQVMGNAVSFLWYALNTANMARGAAGPTAEATADSVE